MSSTGYPEIKVYFSDYFEVPQGEVEGYGAFNISVVNDLPLFVDPFLLFNSDKPEYKALHDEIISYLQFLRNKAAIGQVPSGLIASLYCFHEVKENWMGYSLVGNKGSGLGLRFAHALHQNLQLIFRNFGEETASQSSHLEKLCLIEPGVGKDNISDFAINLIKHHLVTYTEKFAVGRIDGSKLRQVKVPRAYFNYETESWVPMNATLPYLSDLGEYVLLTPRDILTQDDVWIGRSALFTKFDDIVDSIPNDELRAQCNNYFLKVLSQKLEALPVGSKHKEARARGEAISSAIREFPQLLDFFIRYQEEHGDEAVEMSEEQVRQVEQVFVLAAKQLIQTLFEATAFYSTGTSTYDEAMQRVQFFRDVVENKGGHRIFYAGDKPFRRERDLQIMFRLVWFATRSDVSREVNDGRGPADFKISRGATDKTLVEFKLASNRKLEQNLKKQVEIYQAASDARSAIKVIFFFSAEEEQRVLSTLAAVGLRGNPSVVLVDARADNKPSGSIA